MNQAALFDLESTAPGRVSLGFGHDRARLHVGDCIHFLASLPEASVDVIVTDPAYSGMNEHLDFGRGRIVGSRKDPDCDKWFGEFSDSPESFLAFLQGCHRVLRPDRHIYIMFDSFSLLSLGHLARQVFDVKNLLVWDKVNLGMGHYFRRRHELVLFASKGKRKLKTRSSPDVWQIARVSRSGYPTQKPVEVFARMLAESAEPGMVVCDPFYGSGSSAVAAINHGCSFVGVDSSERALAVASGRLQAVLAGQPDPLEVPSNTAMKKAKAKAKPAAAPAKKKQKKAKRGSA